jgi:hypothetical protein
VQSSHAMSRRDLSCHSQSQQHDSRTIAIRGASSTQLSSVCIVPSALCSEFFIPSPADAVTALSFHSLTAPSRHATVFRTLPCHGILCDSAFRLL